MAKTKTIKARLAKPGIYRNGKIAWETDTVNEIELSLFEHINGKIPGLLVEVDGPDKTEPKPEDAEKGTSSPEDKSITGAENK